MTNNQEILFRGFHPCEDGDRTIYVEGKAFQGKWVEGLPGYDINGEMGEIQHFDSPAICRLFDIIPSTVGQYTGLTDKNNEKIFTNDRLDLTDWANRDRTVEVLGFHNGVCWFGGDGFSDEYLFNSSNRLVIGTIFDKPKE